MKHIERISLTVAKHPPNTVAYRGMKEVVNVLDNKVISVLDPSQESGDFLVRRRAKDRQYAFDYAFDSSVGQSEVSLIPLITRPAEPALLGNAGI
jgi:hypothetical protein